jgi:hypothetical protein
VALAWITERPGVTTAVIGARKAHQLELSADEHAAIERVSRPQLIYPYWHQAMNANDRFGAADWVLHADHAEDYQD